MTEAALLIMAKLVMGQPNSSQKKKKRMKQILNLSRINLWTGYPQVSPKNPMIPVTLLNISDMIFNDTKKCPMTLYKKKKISNIITNISYTWKKQKRPKDATNAIITMVTERTHIFSIKLYVPQTVSKKFVASIHSMKFLSPELPLYLYQFIMPLCCKYWCYV